jgi:hypothetical protein
MDEPLIVPLQSRRYRRSHVTSVEIVTPKNVNLIHNVQLKITERALFLLTSTFIGLQNLTLLPKISLHAFIYSLVDNVSYAGAVRTTSDMVGMAVAGSKVQSCRLCLPKK